MRRQVVLALLLVASTASARSRVAVLELAIEGDAEPELRGQLERSIDGGLASAGFDVVTRDEVAAKLRGSRALVGCTSTACLGRIGALVNATRFVKARIEAAGAAYTIELDLLGADAPGGLVQRLERSCPVCTLREVNDLTSRAVVELATGKAPPARAVKITIDSRPAGASVTCDGSLLGVAPVEVELEPGEHVCRATLPAGYRAAEQRETVAPDMPERVVLTLEPEAAAAPVAARVVDRPPGRFGPWKWAAAGGAAAALAGGIALLALDGDGVDCAPGAACRSLYSTKGPGVALVIAGAALGTAATWMFLNDRVEAQVGPTAISARVRF
jgi:hypothetical protein